jgi:hypothetical protein
MSAGLPPKSRVRKKYMEIQTPSVKRIVEIAPIFSLGWPLSEKYNKMLTRMK